MTLLRQPDLHILLAIFLYFYQNVIIIKDFYNNRVVFFLFYCWHLHIWQKEPLELDQHDCSYMKTSTRGMKTKKYHEHVSEIYLFILIPFVYMKYFVHVK